MKVITRYDLEGVGVTVPGLDARLTSGAERQTRANSIGQSPLSIQEQLDASADKGGSTSSSVWLGPVPSSESRASLMPDLPRWVVYGGSIAIGLLAYFKWFKKPRR